MLSEDSRANQCTTRWDSIIDYLQSHAASPTETGLVKHAGAMPLTGNSCQLPPQRQSLASPHFVGRMSNGTCVETSPVALISIHVIYAAHRECTGYTFSEPIIEPWWCWCGEGSGLHASNVVPFLIDGDLKIMMHTASVWGKGTQPHHNFTCAKAQWGVLEHWEQIKGVFGMRECLLAATAFSLIKQVVDSHVAILVCIHANSRMQCSRIIGSQASRCQSTATPLALIKHT